MSFTILVERCCAGKQAAKTGIEKGSFRNLWQFQDFGLNCRTGNYLGESDRCRLLPVVTRCGGLQPGQIRDKLPRTIDLTEAADLFDWRRRRDTVAAIAFIFSDRRRRRGRYGESSSASAVQKIVIYCRYSSDMQSPKSLADPERDVRQALTRMGIPHAHAVVIYDGAESGTTTVRGGFEQIEEMIGRREVAMMAVDDQAQLTRAHNALNFIQDLVYSGGRFISTGDGIDTTEQGWELRVKVMEMHNSTTITELARRVRRGQKGRLLARLTAGDYPFGYRSFVVHPERLENDPRGPKPERDVRIDEEQALGSAKSSRGFSKASR